MKWRIAFICLVLGYGLIILPFTNYLKNRPVEVKLGYLPHPQLLKIVSCEHRTTSAAMIVLRVLFYYGTILQEAQEGNPLRPEFKNMYRTLLGAAQLDPYNMDAYYFAQAAFTWELGRIEEVNHLLKRGMEYRTWDYWLPFYVGFNYAYFLKDYQNAATYMQRAAEISNNSLFVKLAARYLYESEQSAFGLAFLDAMILEARSDTVRRSYEMRRDALKMVITIETALSGYRDRFGRNPEVLQDLVRYDFLLELPEDPYGGNFYLDEQGRVRSSSKFATMSSGQEEERHESN